MFTSGEYEVEISVMKYPPDWLIDRSALDDEAQELARAIIKNPTIVQTDQCFCAISDMYKKDVQDLGGVKNSVLTQVGGLLRRKAYEEVIYVTLVYFIKMN